MPPEDSMELLQPCADIDDTIAFLCDRIGLRLETVFPADAPSIAVVSGHGMRIRLDLDASAAPATLRLPCRSPDGEPELTAPNGTRFVFDEPSADIPLRSSLVITRNDAEAWETGRAGMLYRDLIPDRQGGRFIASHIRIARGGPVPDYVHHHDVRVQMIYCWKGRIRVVYEDQGPPFDLLPGDCVLQPPHIRHRVLECAAGSEVVELASPARHPTHVDHDLTLPTDAVLPDRDFGGQRFVRHVAARAGDDRDERDLGIRDASGGLACGRVVRLKRSARPLRGPHAGELGFFFVLDGTASLTLDGDDEHRLDTGDCATIPAGSEYSLSAATNTAEILVVSVPAR